MEKRLKLYAYLLVPLILVIVLAILGIVSEVIFENLPNYNPTDDSGLKGLAIAIVYLPIFYIGAIILNAPIMWFVLKNIQNVKNLLIKIVLLGSIISSLIIAAIISKLHSDFINIYLSFQFFFLVIGIIWAILSWIILKH